MYSNIPSFYTLFKEYIRVLTYLKPKFFLMENVEGLLLGEAWSYVQDIYKHFNEAGYDVKHYLLKGENMGVPQRRHRVFFVAVKKEYKFDFYDLDLSFDYESVTYGDIKEGQTTPLKPDSKYIPIIAQANENDHNIANTRVRLGEKGSAFQVHYIRDNEVIPTLRAASADVIDLVEVGYISNEVVRNAQTFPIDYNFINNSRSNVGYICGMSVPPVMIKRIVNRLIDTGVFDNE